MLNHDTPEQQSLTPEQIITDAGELMPKKAIFSHIHAFTKQVIESYSIQDFELNVLVQNELKGNIRTIAEETLYKGCNIAGFKAIPLYNLESKELAGYLVLSGDNKKVAMVGSGTPVANMSLSTAQVFVATDNFNLFCKLSELNYVAVFHSQVNEAFKLLDAYFDAYKPRIIATDKQLEHHNDLKIHFDADISHLTSEQIREALSGKSVEIQPTWGELLPLSQDDIVIRPYPIDALPPLAKEAVQAISEHVQSPIAMTAQCVIGALSHIAQAKVNAPHPFQTQGEPCSLFLLTEGQSGSRKSTSKSLADQTIIKHERKKYEEYRRELEQWKSAQAGLPKKDREAYCAENPPPNDPSTIFTDITLESIAGLYIDGILNNASISSDEAGQFFGGHTMKADTRNQALGGYAKLFDDGFVERTRSKSNLNGSGRAYDVRATFNLQGQHEVLSGAVKDPVLRGQGFLPRFLFAKPENLAGTRLQDVIHRNKNASKDHRLIAYWTRCEYLLDDCPHVKSEHELHNGRFVMPMSADAEVIDIEFYNQIEALQKRGKRFEYLQAFASRASQLARRLATIFAYFEGAQWIDAKTLSGACAVVNHSLNEWASYTDIEIKTESEAERLARYLIDKCMSDQTNLFSKTLALKGAPSKLRTVKEFNHYLDTLINHNYVRLVTINKTQYIELNPLLLE